MSSTHLYYSSIHFRQKKVKFHELREQIIYNIIFLTKDYIPGYA